MNLNNNLNLIHKVIVDEDEDGETNLHNYHNFIHK